MSRLQHFQTESHSHLDGPGLPREPRPSPGRRTLDRSRPGVDWDPRARRPKAAWRELETRLGDTMDGNGTGRLVGLGSGRRGSVRIGALLAAVALLAFAASALAAHPKKGARFVGIVIGPKINGFKPPVRFKVSTDGKTLTGFTYSTLGCFGAGGFQPGVDYYTKPSALINVGTVKVSPSGKFSVKGVASVYKGPGGSATTTSTISGSFTSPTAVTGTITFAQKLSPGGGTCNTSSFPVQFSAKA